MTGTSDDGVPCMIMRGGSSKGAYFLATDLPAEGETRDELLRRIIGSPDPRQIDGIGGAHPLTSKVAVVAPSEQPGSDVDYLFLQLGVDDEMVSDRQNCGNLLAGVGPFAVERGLVTVDPAADRASLRVHMQNTGSVATARFPISGGRPVYDGATSIAGVPGTAAAVSLEFDDLAGGSTGALLPTGNSCDMVDGVACTLVDNGMPVVVLAASTLGKTGYESCQELEQDRDLVAKLEAIRLEAGRLMNLGDVSGSSVPKLTMVAPPRDGGHLCTRTFIPHRCHDAIGVLGAVSVATASLLPGTPAAELLDHDGGDSVVLEHPGGTFEALIELGPDRATVRRAGIIRTARKLMEGTVFPRP